MEWKAMRSVKQMVHFGVIWIFLLKNAIKTVTIKKYFSIHKISSLIKIHILLSLKNDKKNPTLRIIVIFFSFIITGVP